MKDASFGSSTFIFAQASNIPQLIFEFFDIMKKAPPNCPIEKRFLTKSPNWNKNGRDEAQI